MSMRRTPEMVAGGLEEQASEPILEASGHKIGHSDASADATTGAKSSKTTRARQGSNLGPTDYEPMNLYWY